MLPDIRYKKANIGKRFFPLGGMYYPLSPWVLDSDSYKKEQAWLNKAWCMLAEEGLVTFETEPERTQVAIRAMALALMYLDFCSKVFEEMTDEPPVVNWTDILGLTKEMLLASYNSLSQTSYTIQDIEDEGEEYLWSMIVNNVRSEVFDALLKRYGDIDVFFESLAEIHRYDKDNSFDAFAWFEEKMPAE
jgi:hypothetical protein